MKSSFPRLHLQFPARSYAHPARASTQTDLFSASSYLIMRLPTPIPTLDQAWATLVRARTEAWTFTSFLLPRLTPM